jgi:hypothetical protein
MLEDTAVIADERKALQALTFTSSPFMDRI